MMELLSFYFQVAGFLISFSFPLWPARDFTSLSQASAMVLIPCHNISVQRQSTGTLAV